MNREEAVKKVITILKSNDAHFKANGVDRIDNKQDYAYLVVRGGAGTGKSRACRETKRMVGDFIKTKTLPTYYQYSIFLLMDYSNGDRILSEEKSNGADVALALRIFLKLFGIMTPSDYVKTQEYQFLCQKNILTLNAIFQVASERFHHYFNLKSDVEIPMILLLDEFQKTISDFSGNGQREKVENDVITVVNTPFWRNPLHRIGEYCVNTAKVNENYNRDHLMVTAMIAGTLNRHDLQFHPTDYGKEYIPLPLFKFDMVLNILQYATQAHFIPKWTIGPVYYRFWWMMGLIPRTLVFALRELRTLNYEENREKVEANDNDILENMYAKSETALTKAYTNDFKDMDKDDMALLLKVACSNIRLSCFGKQLATWIEDKKRTGVIFINSEQETIFLPHVVFQELNDAADKREKAPLPKLPKFYQFNWEDFESVDLKKITNSFNLLFEQKIESISIRDFLRAGGNENTLEIEISPNKRAFREEVEPFIYVNNENQIEYHHLEDVVVTGKSVKKEELLDYVFKTYRGCYLIDGRIFLDKKHLLLSQYKYRLPSEGVTTEANDVLDWVSAVKSALEKNYSSYTLIYLYVTTSMIPEKQKVAIRNSEDNVLFVDRSNIESYVPTNLYPYLMTPSNDEIELLKFIEANHIEKTTTRTSITIADMKEVLDFLRVPNMDRKELRLFEDYLRFTLERIQGFSRKEIQSSWDQKDL
jgi:hypothetical protein